MSTPYHYDSWATIIRYVTQRPYVLQKNEEDYSWIDKYRWLSNELVALLIKKSPNIILNHGVDSSSYLWKMSTIDNSQIALTKYLKPWREQAKEAKNEKQAELDQSVKQAWASKNYRLIQELLIKLELPLINQDGRTVLDELAEHLYTQSAQESNTDEDSAFLNLFEYCLDMMCRDQEIFKTLKNHPMYSWANIIKHVVYMPLILQNKGDYKRLSSELVFMLTNKSPDFILGLDYAEGELWCVQMWCAQLCNGKKDQSTIDIKAYHKKYIQPWKAQAKKAKQKQQEKQEERAEREALADHPVNDSLCKYLTRILGSVFR